MIKELARSAGLVKGAQIVNRNNKKSKPIIKIRKKKIMIVKRNSNGFI